jgi:hypothetical protein
MVFIVDDTFLDGYHHHHIILLHWLTLFVFVVGIVVVFMSCNIFSSVLLFSLSLFIVRFTTLPPPITNQNRMYTIKV